MSSFDDDAFEREAFADTSWSFRNLFANTWQAIVNTKVKIATQLSLRLKM